MRTAYDLEWAEQRCARAWEQLGAPSRADFGPLAERYREPQRAYHTAQHLTECFAWLAQVDEQAPAPHELALALAYHDAVYDPRAHDNEAASARLFLDDARRAGLADVVARRVAALIEQTATHDDPRDEARWLNDIDLAILGAPERRFLEFERQVRVEYGFVEPQAYAVGRARVLHTFAARPSVFATRYFSRRLESRARDNLARALSALEPGPRREHERQKAP